MNNDITYRDALRLARAALKDCRASGRLDDASWTLASNAIRAIDAVPAVSDQLPAQWSPAAEELGALICSVADNLGDMPVSDEWAAKTAARAVAPLERFDYFRPPNI